MKAPGGTGLPEQCRVEDDAVLALLREGLVAKKSGPTKPLSDAVTPSEEAVLQQLSFRCELTCVIVMLLLLLGCCLHAAFSLTVTHDEIWHLPVGLRNLTEGRFDIETVNPPLTRMWGAVPLAIGGIQIDPNVTGQGVGRKFVEDHRNDFQKWYNWGRVFHLLWPLATGIAVYLWSRRLWGVYGAQLSLLLYVTCPNVVGYSSVVTPDAGAMFGFVSTLLAAMWWADRPDWRRATICGTLLGIALATKFTSLLLVPMLCMIVAIRVLLTAKRSSWREASRGIAHLGLMAICSWLILAASYRMDGVMTPLSQLNFQSAGLKGIQNLFLSLSSFPCIVPREYLLGIDEQRRVMAGQHPVFLNGQWSLDGFRSYFFYAVADKTPHILQLLTLLSLFSLFRWRRGARWGDVSIIVFTIGILLITAGMESLQLGVRYVLMVFPLLAILAGGALTLLLKFSPRKQQGAFAVITMVCLLSLRFAPNHLSYFNEWAGGPVGGRMHLIDSNLDWGQNLHDLKHEMKQRGLDSIGLAYFGTVPPAVLGIDYELPPSRSPQPGTYAVSVNFVMGRPHGVTLADGTDRPVDFQEFGYFRFFGPVKTLGGSIDLYEISSEDLEKWHAALRELSR